MSKKNKKQTDTPNIKATAALFFVMGLVTVYSIVPDNIIALAAYSIVVGGALLYYTMVYCKKQQDQEQDAVCSKLEGLKAKMEADEAKLAETEKQIAQLEANWPQVQAELETASDMTVKQWQTLCETIEKMAFAAKQGQQYKKLMTIFSGKASDAVLTAGEADKAKQLYEAIYTNGLLAMKKQYLGEKNARADIKANIEKDIRKTKKKRRK